jgi:HJR/Mrr/RecB family endonuclease
VASGRARNDGSCGALVAAAVVLAALGSGLSLTTSDNIWLALLVLAGIAGAAVWLVRGVAGPKTPTARELEGRFEVARAMSGPQFEVFVADLFRAMGHGVAMLGGAGDQGVDIVVSYHGERVAVQCKNYRRAVGNKPVQEVFAGARHHGCQQAWVVAPAGYTRGAYELASSTGVSLYDANSIRRWIRKVDRLEKERANEGRPPRSDAAGDERAIEEARRRASWYPHPDDPT